MVEVILKAIVDTFGFLCKFLLLILMNVCGMTICLVTGFRWYNNLIRNIITFLTAVMFIYMIYKKYCETSEKAVENFVEDTGQEIVENILKECEYEENENSFCGVNDATGNCADKTSEENITENQDLRTKEDTLLERKP